jgi:lipopolysaccharide transport system permease protein
VAFDPEVHWLGSVVPPPGAADAPIPIVIEPRTGLARLGLPHVWEYRHLLWFFALRTIRGRYRPTALGRGWILLRPLLLCLVYVAVFGVIFRIQTAPIPFPLFVFTGIIVFQFFSGGVIDAASSLISNYSIMSKVYYPRLIVPLTSLVVNAVDLAATLVIVVAMMALYRVVPPWPAVLAAPAFLGGMALATFALGTLLAAATVRTRDVLVALPVVMRVLIYAMPATYPVSLIPASVRPIYYLNPMAVYLQGFRWATMAAEAPPAWSIAVSTLVVIGTLIYALYYFNRVERTMVDVL